MVGRRRFSHALAASGALVAGLALVVPPAAPVTAAAPVAGATRADPPEDEQSPLDVTILSMTPSLPSTTGNVVVTGTVTNRTEEPWRDIRLYAVDGGVINGDEPVDPMRTPGQLQQAMASPDDEVIGSRVTEGTPQKIDDLAPGATADYTVVAPADAVRADQTGVYWFGVHALGISDSVPDDLTADGRARTFLPNLPPSVGATPVTVSVVVPLTHSVRYAADGSVDDEEAWARDLGRGRLERLLDLVAAAPDDARLTWLVDPAVVDAVAHLAGGNLPRTLGPATPASGSPTTDPADGDSEEPADDAAADAEPAADSETAQVAAAWLERLRGLLADDEVLTVPYGNVDVPGTLAHDPALLDLALAQRSATLEAWDVESRPVITSPSGYLDTASIEAADRDTRVLVTDRMLGASAPVVADVGDHRLLVTSYGATQGSPGPGRSLTAVGIRQRLLAEAALRVVRSDRQPLVAVLPLDWSLDEQGTFWNGLDAPWIQLGTLADAEADATAVDVAAADLDYPERQQRRELRAPTVDGVADLVEAGGTLQNLLVDNTGIAGTLTEEALTGLSYHVRDDQSVGRAATARIRTWVADRLGDVEIDASNGVTLASDTGDFVVTLTNTLDHRVAVSVRARSDAGIQVSAPERIVLQADARATVRLKARTTTNAVHNVELVVTDEDGVPLGSTAMIPIRPTQVSGVIWLIMGTGAGVLLVAIVLRLVRRVGAARRGEPGAGRRATQVGTG